MTDKPTFRVITDADAEDAADRGETLEAQGTVAEAPSPVSGATAEPTPAPVLPRRRRSLARPVLFALLPVALVVGV